VMAKEAARKGGSLKHPVEPQYLSDRSAPIIPAPIRSRAEQNRAFRIFDLDQIATWGGF
jgi:hypothetical protein